jgi:hypothetical protein
MLRLLTAATSGEELDTRTAQRIAARELASERARPGALSAPPVRITVQNARAEFIRRVNAVALRLRNPITPSTTPKGPTEQPRVKPRPLMRAGKITKQQVEPSPPAPEPVLLYSSNSTAAAELIGDEQFHTSVLDIPTANWRRSIIENERRAQQRKQSRWVG